MSGTRKMFVNLAVEDLTRSVEFFTALGFEFNPEFTDETATCMLVGADAFVMLLVRDKLAEFSAKPLVNAHEHTEALLAFDAGSREAVDDLADKALAAGGAKAYDPKDYGFMYARSFLDPDGHQWEVFWMDETAKPTA